MECCLPQAPEPYRTQFAEVAAVCEEIAPGRWRVLPEYQYAFYCEEEDGMPLSDMAWRHLVRRARDYRYRIGPHSPKHLRDTVGEALAKMEACGCQVNQREYPHMVVYRPDGSQYEFDASEGGLARAIQFAEGGAGT